MKHFKCNTIEQYYAYQWIKDNFVISSLKSVKKWSANSLLITDKNMEHMIVAYKDGKIFYA